MSEASKAGRLAVGAMALVIATLALIVVGASVRAHGAGLACPDWPLCFGEVIPQIDFLVAWEFGHRVFAGLVSLAFVVLGWRVLREPGLRPRLGGLFAAAAAVLGLQIVLGGLTVLELLAEWTVTSHLVVGNTFVLLLFLIALTLREIARPVSRPPVRLLARSAAIVMAILVLAQLTVGGLVASSGAGLACGTWPGCNGPVWFPTFEGLIGLQVIHRLLAYGLLVAALVTVLACRASRPSLVLFALMLLQAGIGVANVLLHLPVELTVLHTGGAALIVLATTWLNREVWSAPLEAQVASPVGVSPLPEAS